MRCRVHGAVPGPDPGPGWVGSLGTGRASSAGVVGLAILLGAIGLLIAVPALIAASTPGVLIGVALFVVDGMLIRAQFGRRDAPIDSGPEGRSNET